MTELIVCALPSSAPDRGHVAEARRSLSAQGYDVDDARCSQTLWITRALPVAVLALADVRAEAPLDRTRLSRPRSFVRAAAPRHLLVVSAMHPAGDEIHVRFLDASALDEPAVAFVTFAVDREEREAPVVHRFTHGPR
jgi:hypothetical protein